MIRPNMPIWVMAPVPVSIAAKRPLTQSRPYGFTSFITDFCQKGM